MKSQSFSKGNKIKSFSSWLSDFVAHLMFSTAFLAPRGLSKPSFILLRQSNKHPLHQARTILIHLPGLQESLLRGCVAVFEDTRIRIRYLPIGSSPEINHTL
jgi:hypothetical protein